MNKYYKELLGMMNKNENEVKRLLILNYANALTEIKKELKDYMSRYDDLTYSQMLQCNRLKSLEAQINSILDKLYNTNSKDISNHAF
ncbi:head protein, partial [Clostridium perfringens]|nr:head protein [Clostridium perfringens]MBI6097735.1 head protein [Clostridium perfringens]